MEPVVANPGTYRAQLYAGGAVAILLPDGKRLGVKPGEFHFVCPYADGFTRYHDGWKIDVPAGQRLWGKETYAVGACADGFAPRELHPPTWLRDNGGLWFPADGTEPTSPISERGKTRVSIHMPRWASRLTLEVLSVRLERLQDISDEDAKSEGIERHNDDGVTYYGPLNAGDARPVEAFRHLWDSINGERTGCSWQANPWVWRVEFKRAEQIREAA
jgi:hypothetical protein